MPLKPSRRIPRRFQRPPSALSAQCASRLQKGRSRKGEWRTRLALLFRKLRRSDRSVRAALRRFRFLVTLGIAGMALSFFTVLFLSPLFTVSSMSIRRQDARIDIEETQRLLAPFFGRHLLFLPSSEVERAISAAYPEVREVRVEKRLPHELRVTLTMKDIAADVLLGRPDDTEGQAATATGGSLHRFLTADGIYLEYPQGVAVSGKTADRLPLHIVDWIVKPVHRQALLSPDILHEMASTRTVLRESFGHTVRSMTLYLRAKEFHVQTERVVLWFDFASPVAAQLDRYRAFLRALPLTESEKYVDLRLHDRVVYR